MKLTPAQHAWLAHDAHETLGLTTGRTRILAAVLDREELFSFRGIGRLTGHSGENVRLALEQMAARELINLRQVAHPRRPMASFTAELGRRLELIFLSLAPAHSQPPPESTGPVAQNP